MVRLQSFLSLLPITLLARAIPTGPPDLNPTVHIGATLDRPSNHEKAKTDKNGINSETYALVQRRTFSDDDSYYFSDQGQGRNPSYRKKTNDRRPSRSPSFSSSSSRDASPPRSRPATSGSGQDSLFLYFILERPEQIVKETGKTYEGEKRKLKVDYGKPATQITVDQVKADFVKMFEEEFAQNKMSRNNENMLEWWGRDFFYDSSKQLATPNYLEVLRKWDGAKSLDYYRVKAGNVICAPAPATVRSSIWETKTISSSIQKGGVTSRVQQSEDWLEICIGKAKDRRHAECRYVFFSDRSTGSVTKAILVERIQATFKGLVDLPSDITIEYIVREGQVRKIKTVERADSLKSLRIAYGSATLYASLDF
ncbi:uncharacterized protein PgNI_00120 [Pyricularia grisea]|uniref:Uncharacterized protein n=1 Tax=Pyricularia grisea TaxID=148305 RepID=A0A6P8BK95_PYRGI|nr:uncharacterized protein PgNI_00120 [Pyricularia grisea]TLD16997.1 hypothetical protein PgNI_00120 [Pyricularia grisea]